jgi:hypothetical protein
MIARDIDTHCQRWLPVRARLLAKLTTPAHASPACSLRRGIGWQAELGHLTVRRRQRDRRESTRRSSGAEPKTLA